MAGIWMDEIKRSHAKDINSNMSSGVRYLQIQQPTWAVYSVRAVGWQQQWWWDWGLLWKMSLQKGALGSSRDKSLIVTVCRSHCGGLEPVGPFVNILTANAGKVCQVVQQLASRVRFNNETWGGQAEDGQLVLMLNSVSLSGVANKILRGVCEVWALVFLCQTKWQETDSLEGWGGVVVGRVDISAVVVEGGNGICCLHFIPFLMVPF